MPVQIGEACRDWRQGDVFRGGRALAFDEMWRPKDVATVHGTVIVSQTCDACLPHRPMIQLAPVVEIVDENAIREATDGKRPQYVAIPRLGRQYFGDLEVITTVAKTALKDFERVAGVQSDEEVRQFAFAVSRRFGRFAYPDDVVDVLDPLSDVLASRARRENSPMGRALAGVHSIRVGCEDWTSPPYDLTLIVIMEPQVIPVDIDDLTEPADLEARANVKPSHSQKDRAAKYAEFLGGVDCSPIERYFMWARLIESWASQCEDRAAERGLSPVVRSVTAELAVVDEFPLSRVMRTESLDLDRVSDSRRPMT